MLFIWENFLQDQLDLIFIYTADNKVTIVQFGSEKLLLHLVVIFMCVYQYEFPTTVLFKTGARL